MFSLSVSGYYVSPIAREALPTHSKMAEDLGHTRDNVGDLQVCKYNHNFYHFSILTSLIYDLGHTRNNMGDLQVCEYNHNVYHFSIFNVPHL